MNVSSQQRVFRLLCRHVGDRLSKRDIASRLGISPTSASNAVTSLGRLVRVERVKRTDFVSLDTTSERAAGLKRVENLRCIYESGLVEYLRSKAPGTTVVLFGSYSLGEDTVRSDIDIAIIGRARVDLDLDRFEQELFRPINVSTFERWSDIHVHLRSNILGGIVLHGSVDLEAVEDVRRVPR